MAKFYQTLKKCTLAIALCVLPALSASASDTYEFQTVATGLSLPTDVAFAPGQTDRVYVTELFAEGTGVNVGRTVGRVSTIDLATNTRTTFLEESRISLGPEGGVHSIVFHPDFETNNKFYLSWIIHNPDFSGGLNPGSRVDEYEVVGGVPEFQRVILEEQMLIRSPFHGVADLSFDPTATGAARDYLYISTGDGGFQANSPDFPNVSQDLSSPFGKILRVGVGGTDDLPGDPSRSYSIPADNPYNDGDASTDGAVWLSGLRNPWKFSFDRDTGDLYIGDVGYNNREELNFVAAGESGIDFGWGQREGTIATPDANSGTVHQWFTGEKGDSRDPFFEGDHNSNNGSLHSSIVGGFVYRGPIAELQGKYFFADTRTDKLFTLDFDPNTDPALFDGQDFTNFDFENITEEALADLGLTTFEGFGGGIPDALVSFGEDASGNLYIANISRGEIYAIVAVPEPSSLILMLSALFVAKLTRRRFCC